MSFCSSLNTQCSRWTGGRAGPLRVGEDFWFTTVQEIQDRFPLRPPTSPPGSCLQSPLGCVEFRVSLSYKFQLLALTAQGYLTTRHKAARFPSAHMAHCLHGDGVGEITLGLVGPKGLVTTPPNIVISYLSHNFISSQ